MCNLNDGKGRNEGVSRHPGRGGEMRNSFQRILIRKVIIVLGGKGLGRPVKLGQRPKKQISLALFRKVA